MNHRVENLKRQRHTVAHCAFGKTRRRVSGQVSGRVSDPGQFVGHPVVLVSCLPLPACGPPGLVSRGSTTPGLLRSQQFVGFPSVAWPSTGGRFPSTLQRKRPGLRPSDPRTARRTCRSSFRKSFLTSNSPSRWREGQAAPSLFCKCLLCVLVPFRPFSSTANFSGKRRRWLFGSSVIPTSFIRFPVSHVVVHQETIS